MGRREERHVAVRMGSIASRVICRVAVAVGLMDSPEEIQEDLAIADTFFVENHYIFTPLVKQALKGRGMKAVPNSVELGVRQATNSDKEFAKGIARYASFMWIRWRTNIPFAQLDPDQHIVNHISTEQLLTIKSKLYHTMRKIHQTTGEQMHPETLVLSDLAADPELAAQVCSVQGAMWIIKPAVGSAGRDIRICNSGEALAIDVQECREEGERRAAAEETAEEIFIVQRYIMNPMLLPGPSGRGHKFDMRLYFYIANVEPMISFMYNDGYLRVNADPYDLSDTDNKQAHITNFHVSKSHPQYDQMKDMVDGMSVRWTFEELGQYLEANHGATNESGLPMIDHVKLQIIEILRQVSITIKDDMNKRPGCFALLGVDVILDENLKVWLIEFTKNPALRKSTPHLASLHSNLVQEICDIALELRDLRLNKQPFDNLNSLKNFMPVFSDSEC